MAATAVHVPSSDPARRRRLLRVGDDRLVARVRAGDDVAFEIIYDRYSRGLLAFCRQMLGSRHEAEDALQHSFASAYRVLRAGAGEIELRPWLYTIARNRCLSALRTRRAQASADGLTTGAGSFEGMSAQVQLRADLRELVDELQRLPDDQRAALVLFELGDESHEQIAAVLGVRREKVKALVFQAREALMRAREARAAPCVDIREQLATVAGRLPRRGMARSHIDRCAGCAEFEREVRRQRTALAAILPLVPTVGLKGSVLGFALGGGAVALGGAGAGGGATVVAGGALAAGGAGGGGVVSGAGAAAAGAIGTAGAATVATGLAAGGGGGLASIPAKAVVAKVLAVVALGGGGSEAQVHRERPSQPVVVHRSTVRPALSAPARPNPHAARRPASSVAAGGGPTTESPASVGSSAPAPAATTAPATAHAPAALAPQAPAPSAVAPSSPAPAASDAPAAAATAPDATPSPDPAPSSTPAPAASPAPAAAPATPTDESPLATAATATGAGSAAPAAAATTDSSGAAGIASTAVDSAAVATAASASASTTP